MVGRDLGTRKRQKRGSVLFFEEPDFFPNSINGDIVKIELDTCLICYGPEPDADDETEQILTLTKDSLTLKRYLYGEIGDCRIYSFAERRISEKTGTAVMNRILEFFEKSRNDILFITDLGNWSLRLNSNENDIFSLSGTPGDKRLVKLSRYIRRKLGIKELFLFDGKNK